MIRDDLCDWTFVNNMTDEDLTPLTTALILGLAEQMSPLEKRRAADLIDESCVYVGDTSVMLGPSIPCGMEPWHDLAAEIRGGQYVLTPPPGTR